MKATLLMLTLLLVTATGWANCEQLTLNEDAQFRACKKAAEEGDPQAQLALGNLYVNRTDFLNDYQRAMRWYQKAAAQGNANAMHNIGVLHDKGWGVRQDFKEAARWYRQAADLGFADALYNIGVMHEYGQEQPQDYEKARQYYLMAAEKGEPSAQFSLGLLYDKGLGVEHDPVKAYMWWEITGAGHMHAEHNKNSIAEEMTPMQIAEAKRLARQWLAERPGLTQLPAQKHLPGFE